MIGGCWPTRGGCPTKPGCKPPWLGANMTCGGGVRLRDRRERGERERERERERVRLDGTPEGAIPEGAITICSRRGERDRDLERERERRRLLDRVEDDSREREREGTITVTGAVGGICGGRPG